jgi:hypothetical protein
VAALFVALWSPSILLAGPAGLLADRLDPRRVLVVASAVQAALAVALALADGTALVLGLAALLGAANAVAAPAEFALLPRVAGTADVGRANGRLEAARYAGFTVGPMAGALLAAAGGAQLALLVDAATFAAIAVVGALIPVRRAATAAVGEDAGRARDGVAFLRRDAVLRGVLPVAVAALLIMTAVWTAEVFFAKDVLHAGDVGYGLMTTAWTVGMVLGATALAPRVPAAAAAGAALAAIAAQGLGIALPAAWPVLAFTLLAFAAGGVAHGTKNVLLRTLIHRRTPEHLHGRAFAAYNALRNTAELSALAAGGVLVTVAGPRLTLAVAGGGSAAIALAALARRGRRPAAAEPLTAPAGAPAALAVTTSARPTPAPAPAAAPPPTPSPAGAPARRARPRAPGASPSPAPVPAAAPGGAAPP